VSSGVVGLLFDKQYSPAWAWRKYLQLSQEECAKKLDLTQQAYSQLQSSKQPRKATVLKLAIALSIHEMPTKLTCIIKNPLRSR
jgi:transcriptional regulator with XRE-family HTH domain